MTLRLGIGTRGRARLLVGLTLCLAWVCAGAAQATAAAAAASSGRAAASALPAWSSVRSPGGGAWTAHDVFAFGAVSLAVAGDGHIAVTRDGGGTWRVVVPAGHGATAFTAIAFTTSGRGVVASGGLLLVTSDWGKTWKTPAYQGPGPGAAVNDVAMHGSRAVAVGDAGMILTSGDSGATWQTTASPTVSALTSVAIAGDGTAVAGAESGELLVGTNAWTVAGIAAGPVTSVTASDAPAWGDGRPDLFAATGHDVLGSDDALAFASLPGLPDLNAQTWPAIAWAGRPERALLIAGAEQAGFLGASRTWQPGLTGLNGVTRAVAPGGQSVAYLLGAEGGLVRSLSAGSDPAVTTLARDRIVVGAKSRLTATVNVAAPGATLLRSRAPGRPWTTLRRISWAAADWSRRVSFALAPSLTHDYRLDFRYGETTVPLTPIARVTVAPKVTTAQARYELRAGDVFRFSGSVAPRLGGERVELFTDRGGSWRPVSLQPSVGLRDGRTWTSRKFGTPRAETYHLRAHVRGSRAHAEAWSRTVTVTIR